MANQITEVRLLAVPLENDYKHTFYFNDATEQSSYFIGKTVFSETDFSYQRKDHYIRYPKHYDDLSGCNYLMYKNSPYSNKWVYAFITEKKYINEERTDIYFETDVMQTYLFDYTIQRSFIEREHCNDDTVGKNTIPENLELGEFVCNAVLEDTDLKEYCYLINTTEYMGEDYSDSSRNKPLAVNMGGVFVSGGVYACQTMAEVVTVVNEFKAVTDAVVSVYMIPKRIIEHDWTGSMQYKGQSSPVVYPFNVNKQTALNGYIPFNKKLLTFPYNYLMVSNNTGSSNIYHYELFSGNTCVFQVAGVPVVGASIKCSPKDYKGITVNEEEGIMCGKYPVLSWSADLYTNWLTQNSLNLNLGVVSGGLQVVAGIGLMATGGGALAGAGSIASGAMSIANTLGQKYQMSFTPNSAKGNTNGGDINTSNKTNTFFFYKMSIKEEYARIIDNYFNMFGYKCNRVKVPLSNHRKYYWYTKTIDVSIDGNITSSDMQKIKNCYNNGITFWRSTIPIGDYSYSNSIL